MNQTIPVEAIKAACLFAAKDMGRYAFHGLLLEHGRLVATDGRRLAVLEWKPAEGDVAPGKGFIIPADVAMAAAKVKRAEAVIVNGAMQPKLAINGTLEAPSFPYQPVEGEFPDWFAVMPRGKDAELKGEAVRFNPSFLADIGKAAGIIQAESESPVVVVGLTGRCTPGDFHAAGERVTMRVILMPVTSPESVRMK